MTNLEKKKFISMLDDYISHIKVTENKSMIARVYGIFNMKKSNYFYGINLMIM
jgi:hypothetical protein